MPAFCMKFCCASFCTSTCRSPSWSNPCRSRKSSGRNHRFSGSNFRRQDAKLAPTGHAKCVLVRRRIPGLHHWRLISSFADVRCEGLPTVLVSCCVIDGFAARLPLSSCCRVREELFTVAGVRHRVRLKCFLLLLCFPCVFVQQAATHFFEQPVLSKVYMFGANLTSGLFVDCVFCRNCGYYSILECLLPIFQPRFAFLADIVLLFVPRDVDSSWV